MKSQRTLLAVSGLIIGALISTIVIIANKGNGQSPAQAQEKPAPQKFAPNFLQIKGTGIQVVKIDSCDYIFVRDSLGVDIEHHAGCEYKKH